MISTLTPSLQLRRHLLHLLSSLQTFSSVYQLFLWSIGPTGFVSGFQDGPAYYAPATADCPLSKTADCLLSTTADCLLSTTDDCPLCPTADCLLSKTADCLLSTTTDCLSSISHQANLVTAPLSIPPDVFSASSRSSSDVPTLSSPTPIVSTNATST